MTHTAVCGAPWGRYRRERRSFVWCLSSSPGETAGHRRSECRHAGDAGGESADDEGEEGDHPGALPLPHVPPGHPGRHHAAPLPAVVWNQCRTYKDHTVHTLYFILFVFMDDCVMCIRGFLLNYFKMYRETINECWFHWDHQLDYFYLKGHCQSWRSSDRRTWFDGPKFVPRNLKFFEEYCFCKLVLAK